MGSAGNSRTSSRNVPDFPRWRRVRRGCVVGMIPAELDDLAPLFVRGAAARIHQRELLDHDRDALRNQQLGAGATAPGL